TPHHRRRLACPHNPAGPCPADGTGWCDRDRPAGRQQHSILVWTSEPLYWTIILQCEIQYQKDAILSFAAVQSSEQIITIAVQTPGSPCQPGFKNEERLYGWINQGLTLHE